MSIPLAERSPREGGEGGEGEKSRIDAIQVVNAVREIWEGPKVEDEGTRALEGVFTEARQEHLGNIAGDGKQIVKVIPSNETTSKVLTGKWVDTYQADGSEKSRWTARCLEQQ
eukprot:4845405-Pyramimonas_sp.AAC.1